MDQTIATYGVYYLLFHTLADNLKVGWLGTTALMLKTNLGLGVLSIPAVFDTLGMIPGIICVIVVASITGWSQYMIGVFKQRHPQVYGIEDVGGMFFGSIARELVGVAFFICEQYHPPCSKNKQALILLPKSGFLFLLQACSVSRLL